MCSLYAKEKGSQYDYQIRIRMINVARVLQIRLLENFGNFSIY